MKREQLARWAWGDLYHKAHSLELAEHPRLVIFSDLHMGNGSPRRDDFAKNREIFAHVLEECYWKRGYSLILNGDVEELQKFRLGTIQKSYSEIYRLFDRFHQAGKLFKTVGNHDSILASLHRLAFPYPYPLYHSLMLKAREGDMLLFHGHQVAPLYTYFNDVIAVLLRYIAYPLGIKNFSLSHDNSKRHKVERSVYELSREKKLVSIIGHTHRPLFESYSKLDTLKYNLESLLRRYRSVDAEERASIRDEIRGYRDYLAKRDEIGEIPDMSLLYSRIIPVPCLFNSGCCVAKGGVTCLEIADDSIALVHWYDSDVIRKDWESPAGGECTLPGTPFRRTILKDDKLSYIYDCIRLLG